MNDCNINLIMIELCNMYMMCESGSRASCLMVLS